MNHRHSHFHQPAGKNDARWLTVALAFNAGFMFVEVVVGIVASSLALLSDAAHMLTDVGAIALALVAFRLAKRGPRGAMTYGLKRVEILSAQANGLILLLLAGFIVYEGVGRLLKPPDVEAPLVLIVSIAGLLVNLAAALALMRASRHSLNIQGAFQHNLMDAYSSVGSATAAGVIIITGFDRADAIASLLIAVPMLSSGYKLVKQASRVFLEAAPENIDPSEVGQALAAVTGVVEVHDLHIWEVTSGFPALSAHVLVGSQTDCHLIRGSLEKMLRERFEISHTTLQVDHKANELLSIEGL